MCSPQTAAAAVAVGQQQHHPLVRMHQHYVQQVGETATSFFTLEDSVAE